MGRRSSAITKALNDWPAEFLYCRDLGHRWHVTSTMKTKKFGVERWASCDVCGTLRQQWIQVSGLDKGRVYAAKYIYPEGYLIPGLSKQGLRKADVRIEHLKIVLGEVKRRGKLKAA